MSDPSAHTATPQAGTGRRNTEQLQRVGADLSLGPYIGSLWARREFALALASGDLRAQNVDTVFGSIWHFLNPLLLSAVYYLMFGVILDISRGVDNFVAFLVIGILVFHYSQKSAIAGAKSITGNMGLIRSIRFPRAVLPLSTLMGQTLAFGPGVLIMLGVALVTGEPISSTWFALVPILGLQCLFNLGLVFVVARLTDIVRDIENVLPYLFRIAFYLSGVLYSVDAFVDDARLRLAFDFNPLFVFVSLARGPLLDQAVETRLLWIAIVWSLALCSVGFWFFRRGEMWYGRP